MKYFEPSFDIDVAHLLPAEEGVIFKNHLMPCHDVDVDEVVDMDDVYDVIYDVYDDLYKDDLVCVPDDNAQLPRGWFSWRYVHLV